MNFCAFAPEILTNTECVGSLSKIYLGVFPASRGARLQEVAARTFSIQMRWIRLRSGIGLRETFFRFMFYRSRSGVWIVFYPVGSKKCGQRFLATGPFEKRETPPTDRPWSEILHILRREEPISNLPGAKTHHADVLKGSFSTDCESDGIRIGLNTCWDL